MNKTFKGFWIRLLAFVIDIILLGLLKVLVLNTGVEFVSMMESTNYVFVFFMLNIIPYFIITILFWQFFGATPGKMIIGAKIVDAKTGQKPTVIQFIKRYIGYFISLNPLLLGFLWSGWDKNKQAVHDKFAGTVVVSSKATGISATAAPLGFMKYVFGIFFVLFVVSIFIIVPQITTDVPIADYTKDWNTADKPEPNPQNNGFYYLAGLFADKDKDVFTEGYNYVNKTNELTKTCESIVEFNENKLKPEIGKSLYETDLNHILQNDTLQILLDNKKLIKKLMQKNSHIEARLEEILSKPDFENKLLPNLNAVRQHMSSVQYCRLVNANVKIDFVNGNKKEAIEELERYLRTSRYLLANASVLIEKLVFVITTQITLNTYSKLADVNMSPELYESIMNIPEFTVAENSMRKAYRGEALFSHPGYKFSFAQDIQRGLDSYTLVPADLLKEITLFLYKPNLTFNMSAENFEKSSDRADLNGDALMEAMKSSKTFKVNLWNFVRNPLGAAMTSENLTSDIFFSYALKNKFIGGNIVMLKLKAEIIKQNISSEQVAEFLLNQPKELWNPISEKPVVWDAGTSELYLDLPIDVEDEQSRRMKIVF